MENSYRVYYDDRSGGELYDGFRKFRKAYERYLEVQKDVGPGKRYRAVWITAVTERVIDSYHGIQT